MTGSWASLPIPALGWLAQLVAIVLVAVLVGKLVPGVRRWLWLAAICHVGGTMIGMAVELIANRVILNSIGGSEPTSAQLDVMFTATMANMALALLGQAAVITCYCVAAVRAAQTAGRHGVSTVR